jgi:hypothetical protein
MPAAKASSTAAMPSASSMDCDECGVRTQNEKRERGNERFGEG